METSRRLPTEKVTVISENLLELFNEQKYRSLFLPVSLINNGELYEYVTLVVCKDTDIKDVYDEVKSFNGANFEDYHLSDRFCHITTALRDSDFSQISFNKRDNSFVRAQFSEDYKVVSGFFDRYFEYCDRLMAKGHKIDDDLLCQYFLNIKNWYDHMMENKNVSKRLKFISNKILKKDVDK